MTMLESLFGNNCPVIGVVHLLPLPGSCRWNGDMDEVIERAEQEALALASGGADGIIVENFFDAPFAKDKADPAVVAALTRALLAIKAVVDLPLGVNVLRNDALSALAVAVAVGAQFVRVNVLSGAMITDQGIIESNARELHLYRKLLSSEDTVKVFADVMVKHAYPMAPGCDLAQSAKDTVYRALADAIIVSGTSTGSSPAKSDIEMVKHAVPGVPVLIGSGASAENAAELLGVADGAIVASSLKRQGKLENCIDVDRVRSLIDAVSRVRTGASPA